MDESKVGENREPEVTKVTSKKREKKFDTVKAVQVYLGFKKPSTVYYHVDMGSINVRRRGDKGRILAFCHECVEAMKVGTVHRSCEFHMKQ